MSSTTKLSKLQVRGSGGPDSQQQQQNQSSGVVRLHSVTACPSATASSVNIFRSLSAIHPSATYLDVASTAGIQVIRPETHPEAFVPVPPDGGWGWIVVFAAFVTNLIIDGICVSFGIMVTDLVDHFNSTVATVMLMGSLLLGVYQIVVFRLLDSSDETRMHLGAFDQEKFYLNASMFLFDPQQILDACKLMLLN
ncbi:unnamed protein product [Hymenolepis diminuta]|uniref:Monocarboxylate transporter n=1 Tax=Hymenolepis diminuta TaxID=6216 RepID=A0A0R3SCT9_HYMDI|nr:unnamed protein product [Hymenolepis diminuta]